MYENIMENLEVVKQLTKMNLTQFQIACATGLTIKQVSKCQHEFDYKYGAWQSIRKPYIEYNKISFLASMQLTKR